MATFVTGAGQQLFNVHEETPLCGIRGCPVHAPSPEAEAIGVTVWTGFAMMRRCDHGYLHPDPDDTNFKQLMGQFMLLEAIYSTHLVEENCDGCCHRELERSERADEDA